MAPVPRTATTPSLSSRGRAEPISPCSPGTLGPTAWRPCQGLTLADWAHQGRWLGALGRACHWWIGDWIRYGNARYGERYDAAVRLTGYDVQSLMNMAYVASRFEISRRREKLSWSHHAELASLEPHDQHRWLDRAEAEGLSVRRLREERRRAQRMARPRTELGTASAALGRIPPGPRREPRAGRGVVVCPECGHRFEPEAAEGRARRAPGGGAPVQGTQGR
jgi:hypothetical protein